MRYKATVVDAVSIERATWLAQKCAVESIRLGKALEKDPEKAKRYEKQLCPTCYYTRGARIGGAAITTRPCGLCLQDQVYSSTSTDALCIKCAKEHRLCKRCGGDIDSHPRAPVRRVRKVHKSE